MKSITENIDYNLPISNYFSKSTYICLSPFYRKIFADNFDWTSQINLTFPLIQNISWEVVSKKIGFNDIIRVALGLLELKEPFKTELNQFCNENLLIPPDYAADEIPEVILIKFLNYLNENGYHKIETKEMSRFPGTENLKINLNKENIYETYHKLKFEKFISAENDINIILSNYDSPYSLITGDEQSCNKMFNELNFETFKVSKKLKFDWWNC